MAIVRSIDAERPRTGLLLGVTAAAAYGVVAIFAKLAFAAGATTGQALTWRFFFATLLLWPVLRLSGTQLTVTRPQLWRLIGLGAIGYFGQALAFFLALQFIPASLAALLLSGVPVLVAVLAYAIWRDLLTRTKLTALALSVIGGALIVGIPNGDADPRGIALAGLCAVAYAAYLLIGNTVIGTIPRPAATIHIMASATAAFAVYAAFTGGIWPDAAPGAWAAFLAMALATSIAMIAFFAGLERLGPTRAAIVGTLEPVVTVVAAAVVLAETVAPVQLIGGGLIIAAVIVLQTERAQRSRAKHPSE